jgi:DNA polymerase-4
MRRILHIDMDAFFSAVEEKRHPELVGKPVVVGGEGDPTKRGVVSTASYEARKFGIHSAMPLKTAYRLCPDAVFLPVDYEEYSRVSGEVKAILRQFSPEIEDVGIDEAFLDISSIDRPSEEISKEIKKRVRDETGLTCSIGIGPNKLLAKIASDMQKPDGLTIIMEDDIRERIWPLSARKLWGVGPKTEAYLKEMGIQTIGDLASLPLDRLIEEFGQSYGNYLYEASRGIDESPLVTHWEPRSISRETTFQKDTDNWQAIAKTLAELTKEIVAGMREEGYQGRTVTVKIRFNDFRTYTRAKTLEDLTDSLEKIRKAAFECLGRVELRKKVRLVGVRISSLEKVSSSSIDTTHSTGQG